MPCRATNLSRSLCLRYMVTSVPNTSVSKGTVIMHFIFHVPHVRSHCLYFALWSHWLVGRLCKCVQTPWSHSLCHLLPFSLCLSRYNANNQITCLISNLDLYFNNDRHTRASNVISFFGQDMKLLIASWTIVTSSHGIGRRASISNRSTMLTFTLSIPICLVWRNWSSPMLKAFSCATTWFQVWWPN